MYQPVLGRFQSRDPVSPNGVDLLDDNNWFAQRQTQMRRRFGDGAASEFTDYTYARNNPITFIDPSGLACRTANPPQHQIPAEDRIFPWSDWRPQPANGYNLTLGRGANVVTFDSVECEGCTMDLEIRARTYRYYRFKDGRFVGHTGAPIGVSNDPRDFFGLAVLTDCKTNIKCCGKALPDATEVVATVPLSKDGRGVFIRYPNGIEDVAAKFSSDQACSFAFDAVVFIQDNVQPGPIDPNLPP